ncbi:hypothetical protein K493DRAFT_60089 [Basidiobolus meristosporus CBS 931.73]|uniref:Uncharacterized protein n=1 Tax=Basidiobolus meristosporus CBS 931.73 TaxID=1314790 RepID=A0A1Y1XX62_9FUNG|nr:hypothetical protein K493DRAFT_60089 [Basidiobolus meristosporus CBS 931.73]|eukprot:ORX90333.1 hypothetical protein K493DRAFT_60089 [Basidiobolus meristosporus CBS 931.73]
MLEFYGNSGEGVRCHHFSSMRPSILGRLVLGHLGIGWFGYWWFGYWVVWVFGYLRFRCLFPNMSFAYLLLPRC